MKVGDKLLCKKDSSCIYDDIILFKGKTYTVIGISRHTYHYFSIMNTIKKRTYYEIIQLDVPLGVVHTSIKQRKNIVEFYIWDVFYKPGEERKSKMNTIYKKSFKDKIKNLWTQLKG